MGSVDEGSVLVAKKKVMVAIDESEYSHYALMWVLENLRDSIKSQPLVIFMAQAPPKYGYAYAASLGAARMYCPVSANPDFVNCVQEQQNKVSKALLERAKEICASEGVNTETVTDIGDPADAICNAVTKLNINLLVLGNRGSGRLKRAFMGSVSNYCVRNAKCPVLVVKKPE